MFTDKQIGRFWSNVDVRGEDDCWTWKKKSRSHNGYGLVGLTDSSGQKKLWRTHRLAWLLANGEIPEGLNVCHHCDNRPCCNPKHLFLGTQKDNIHDSMAKGRFGKGETIHTAKLTEQQARQIKFNLKHMGPTAIVKMLGFPYHTNNIGQIRSGKSWAWVKPVPLDCLATCLEA